ncbi:DEAD/DEAH box helicase [Companilactobacillus alimentarius]|uniref:DEAD-box ATP-dependent RNA helicase CshA n=1 Tax=Companilactobacillus alimentarius DSM 20249 TaxID=1423720 RepID=A0A2K9HHE3_9LACO|nr:DEAD/DEAH box helicase [Companilactobacillus alimentarius]AUI71798.1 ATP-dependent RNA helicase [Companilactobacillus alimentarius DSM 20249]KRK75464.1 ATP-dependent RNA helicase [Companilactobacillus alimentarius DSM 20249]MDT6952317.1 DEAD/DEAH box helicase [Companilactobacillus alimentarius]GEO45904.1 DEAD-box ATP-dependent RNA helicase CshA [Companilactobacillus alimentarius]
MKFKELDLDPRLLSAVNEAGFEETTPIQAQTIPLVMTGDDVIGQAQTGTGKTAAFGLPILNAVDTQSSNIQALIISPTRELAIQTQEELYRLGSDKKVKVQCVYGGSDIRRQIRALKNHPQIVVGTPGRMLDHINRHTLKLGNVKTVVLDEADEMLDMGFVEDIENILSNVPHEHQTLLFSATMPKPIMKIADKFMTDPKVVKIKSKELTADKIEQYFVKAREFEKFDLMTRLFDVQAPELALIFGRTKRRVDELTRGLQARGYNAEGIHGDLSQDKRTSVLRKFKSGKLDFLVATDVAARGLDISGVSHVYNYDIPQDPDSYVHRIGRTGRAGHSGVSVTFVTPNEMSYLRTIENLTKKRMEPLAPPTDKEVLKGQLESVKEDIKDTLEHDKHLDRFDSAVEELLANYSAEDIARVFLSETIKDAESVPIKIAPERPLPSRKVSHSRSGHGRRGKYNHHRGGGNGENNHRRRRNDRRDNHNDKHGDSKHREHDNKRNGRSKKSFKIRTNL